MKQNTIIYPNKPKKLINYPSIKPTLNKTPIIYKTQNYLIKQITKYNTYIQIIKL